MIVRYRNKKLEKAFNSSKQLAREYGQLAKKIQSRLDDIAASPNLKVLMQLPAAGCHRLQGNRSEEWALWVSGNWRLIFTLDHDPPPMKSGSELDLEMITNILILEITDYH